MKAIILAGGRGKRLRPITDIIPKSLIPINNIPIIEWQIKYFKKFKINEFIICIGHLGNQIQQYLATKNNFDTKISFSIEKKPLGTGGAIKQAITIIKSNSYIISNGDIITNMNLNTLISTSNSIATIPLRTKFGVINIINNKIMSFDEKIELSKYWMNAGIYHLTKELIKKLPKKGNIENTLFSTHAKKLTAIKHKNIFWNAIDSYKDIDDCTTIIKKLY